MSSETFIVGRHMSHRIGLWIGEGRHIEYKSEIRDQVGWLGDRVMGVVGLGAC